MPLERKTDRRVLKTRKAIKDTFKEMVMEMDASKITIKELAERAQIHRKTFYLHYTSIEALYEDILQEIAEKYFEEIDDIAPDAPFTEVNRVFFTFVSGLDPYCEKMLCSPGYREFSDRIFLTMLKHNRTRYNPYSDYTEDQQNIINIFLCLTSVNIYRYWVSKNKKMPLDELIDFSNQLFMNGISSVRKI
ncbi:MAG: TetR/AcrR family transcriptional regulator [Anaerovoracaceae bacterium]|jgi:AcrR family transcriptional regulator